MKTAIFGTFDIGNFGDLIFPIVAEKKLSELGPVNMTRFSYRRKRCDSWCYDVEAIQDFPSHAADTSLVMIGGGHLVHFNRLMAHNYIPTDPSIPHPLGFWWVPAIAARRAGIPSVLNAVSVGTWQPRWAEALMKAFVESLDYIAVRDMESKARLMRFGGPDVKIHVVPDTVHSISDVIVRGRYSEAFERLRVDAQLNSDYVIVQPSDAILPHLDAVNDLIGEATALGLDVLELPIFNEAVDSGGLYRSNSTVKRLPAWPDPKLLAEIIANSQAVVGVSLHLSIVASAYGIPIHRPAYSRDSKFTALDGLPRMAWLHDSPKLHVGDTREVDMSEVDRRKQALNEHWRRIHELTEASRSAQSVCGWEEIIQTPSAFRRSRGIHDRVVETKFETVRRRRLVMQAIRDRSLPDARVVFGHRLGSLNRLQSHH